MNENDSRLDLYLTTPESMDILTARAAGLLAAVDSPAIDNSRQTSLADLPRGILATVAGVLPSAMAEDADLVRRLIEIGFVPGEQSG